MRGGYWGNGLLVQRNVLLFYLILPGLLAVVCVTGRGMISSRWGRARWEAREHGCPISVFLRRCGEGDNLEHLEDLEDLVYPRSQSASQQASQPGNLSIIIHSFIHFTSKQIL